MEQNNSKYEELIGFLRILLISAIPLKCECPRHMYILLIISTYN